MKRFCLLFVFALLKMSVNAQSNKINKELKFNLIFTNQKDTLNINEPHYIIINGSFPKDNSGHQGGLKQNFIKTKKDGQFQLYIVNQGTYEFNILGKGIKTIYIQEIKDYKITIEVKPDK